MIAVDQYLQQKCGYIGELFDSKQPRFLLPNLQRSFKWDKKHISQLWSDLNDYRHVNHLTKSFDYGNKNPIFNRTPPYLLGTIYVTESNENGNEKFRQLIDGQQRLTTISLSVIVFREILAALEEKKEIRDELKNLDERLAHGYTVAKLFNAAELVLYDRDSPNLVYPQASNNEFWKRLVTAKKLGDFQKALDKHDKESETQTNIAEAFNVIRRCVSDYLNYDDFYKGRNIVWRRPSQKRAGKWDVSGIQRLIAEKDEKGFEEVIINFAGLLALLIDCVCLVQFSCTSEQQVSLFDIINNRGEPFDMPDMVRLMLFSHTDKTMHDELNKVWTDANVDENLLAWVWNAFYADPVNLAKNKLQFQIEKILDAEEMSPSMATKWAMDFADYCKECSSTLTDIGASFNTTLFSDGNFYKVAFLTSNDYVKFSRPILFALEHFVNNVEEKRKIYHYLLNFIVRITITREKESKVIGNTLPRLAVCICQTIREDENSGALLEKIKDLVKKSPIYATVTNDMFIQKFLKFSLDQSSARFGYLVIGSLENFKSGNKSATNLTYYSNDDAVQSNNLEHIFPQTPVKEFWPEADAKDVKECIGMFGNLLPINKSANSKIKNKGVKDKIAVYAEQHLSLWPELEAAIYDNTEGTACSWTLDKIRQRTDKLSQEAAKVFSIA